VAQTAHADRRQAESDALAAFVAEPSKPSRSVFDEGFA
jgi:hypothetical protein